MLIKNGIAISKDGKGSWRDNIFVERLWRSVKYEEVYLRAYNTVSEARPYIGQYLGFYSSRRPHKSLDRQTPDQAYFPRCRMSRRLNPGGRSTYQTGEPVQTSGANSDIVFLLVSFAHAWIKASVFEKHAEPQAPSARHRRCIVRAHYRFLVA